MPKKVMKLNNWSVVYAGGDPYTPPECRTRSLYGIVDNHPKLGSGVPVTTSTIVSAKGRIVRTFSGSCYQLGKPSKDYLIWLKTNNIRMDEENPIRI